MSESLTIRWITEQRARSDLAAMVDTHTFRLVLDNLEATMQREARLRDALDSIANTLCDTRQYLNDDLVKHAFEVAAQALASE